MYYYMILWNEEFLIITGSIVDLFTQIKEYDDTM